jgi:Fe-S cluster biosynthesis and repair protein YggX
MYGVKRGNFKNQFAIGIVCENVHKELELILDEDCGGEIGKRIQQELVKLSLRTWWSSKINLNDFIEKLRKEHINDAD